MWVASAIFLSLMVAAALFDLISRRIPNWLNLAALVIGLGLRLATLGPRGASAGLLGALVGFGLLFVLFAVGWIGAGDVKLATAAGAWLGPYGALVATLAGLAGGGLAALVVLLRGGRALRAEVRENLEAALYSTSAPAAPRRAAHRVPAGVPLALAAAGLFIWKGGLHA